MERLIDSHGRRIKWTIAATLGFYFELKRRFGPHKMWIMEGYPINQKYEYDKFCEGYSISLDLKSEESAKNQVSWATGKPPRIPNRHNHGNMFRNKIIAKAVGFIDDDYMPYYSEYPKWTNVEEVDINKVFEDVETCGECADCDCGYDEVEAAHWGVAI